MRPDPRGLAESPGRTNNARFRQGLHDVLTGQLVGAQAVDIQPDPHRIGAVAEIPGDTHPLDPLDLGHDVGVGEVVKEFLVDAWIRAVNVHVHQHAGHDRQDDDPLALHQRGSWLRTMLTRLSTFTALMLGSVPGSKKIVIAASPALVAAEAM